MGNRPVAGGPHNPAAVMTPVRPSYTGRRQQPSSAHVDPRVAATSWTRCTARIRWRSSGAPPARCLALALLAALRSASRLRCSRCRAPGAPPPAPAARAPGAPPPAPAARPLALRLRCSARGPRRLPRPQLAVLFIVQQGGGVFHVALGLRLVEPQGMSVARFSFESVARAGVNIVGFGASGGDPLDRAFLQARPEKLANAFNLIPSPRNLTMARSAGYQLVLDEKRRRPSASSRGHLALCPGKGRGV